MGMRNAGLWQGNGELHRGVGGCRLTVESSGPSVGGVLVVLQSSPVHSAEGESTWEGIVTCSRWCGAALPCPGYGSAFQTPSLWTVAVLEILSAQLINGSSIREAFWKASLGLFPFPGALCSVD